jgi:hypothetical protein
MMIRSWVPLAALAALLVASAETSAQVKPFKMSGAGVVDYIPLPGDEPALHWAIGKATHLGKYYCEGFVRTDILTSPTTANFSSAEPCVFTAANGDKLAFHYGREDYGAQGPGVVELFDAGDGKVFTIWVAEFNPVPELCTGKFSKVIGGSFIMVAITDPFVLGADEPVAYTWSGKGSIEFKK